MQRRNLLLFVYLQRNPFDCDPHSLPIGLTSTEDENRIDGERHQTQ